MLKKILVVFFFSGIIIFIIYKLLNNKDYYYLAIGDDLAKGRNSSNNYGDSYVDYYYYYLKSNYKNVVINKDYIYEDIRIKDLNNYIKENEKINTISQEIKKADVITLSIGSEELFSKLRTNIEIKENSIGKTYIDKMFSDLDELIKNIRKLTKKDIFVVGYYNPIRLYPDNERVIKEIFDYIDNKFIEIEKKYNIKYIEINNEFIKRDYLFVPNIINSYPTEDAYYYIYEQIKKES